MRFAAVQMENTGDTPGASPVFVFPYLLSYQRLVLDPLRLICGAVGSNSRAHSAGLRPARTKFNQLLSEGRRVGGMTPSRCELPLHEQRDIHEIGPTPPLHESAHPWT